MGRDDGRHDVTLAGGAGAGGNAINTDIVHFRKIGQGLFDVFGKDKIPVTPEPATLAEVKL